VLKKYNVVTIQKDLMLGFNSIEIEYCKRVKHFKTIKSQERDNYFYRLSVTKASAVCIQKFEGNDSESLNYLKFLSTS